MSAIPRALENPSLDGGFWQIRTFAATWLNGTLWSEAADPLPDALQRSLLASTVVARSLL